MEPLERRLHPASILFLFATSLKAFALPGLLVIFSRSCGFRQSGGVNGFPDYGFPRYDVWIMFLLIPSLLVAIVRYLSFRMRYEGTELVIRSGFIFRNVRHVPYARIQNLDAVQNVFHRLLKVTEVRVETGAGKEPEATIRVVPVAVFHEMRRRVFERHAEVNAAAEGAAVPIAAEAPAVQSRTLLTLTVSDLLLFGFLENRGMVIVGAVYGVLWELGLLDSVWNPMFSENSYGRGVIRQVVSAVRAGEWLTPSQVALVVSSLLGFLVLVRLLSMVWAVIRLYGFTLTRIDDDLRTEFGLFTRVAATIPLRRIQTITVREGPLFRLVNRLGVRVETAGGGPAKNAAASAREWLAPLLRTDDLPRLLDEVQPGLALTAFDWHAAHPRAFRRAVKPRLIATGLLAGLSSFLLGWWAIVLLVLMVPVAVLAAHKYVLHLGWAETDDVVAFRSGWLWRSLTVARVAKIQSVTLVESPRDRWAAMARVRVDTAGAGERSHRVNIPYLDRRVAVDLQRRWSTSAAHTAFQW
jgi:putative membrane protein